MYRDTSSVDCAPLISDQRHKSKYIKCYIIPSGCPIYTMTFRI